MRNFKKFLALVLAMLMVSACAVSVAAFDDVADTDDYAEAVELLADLGVISGRNDGTNNFYPNDTLTREEAAVIAAKILAGAKAVEWTAATTRFTDVFDAWSFAFINYVDEENVMIGNDNGEFEPKEKLQIDQAIKIALAIADTKAAFNASVEQAKNPTMAWWTFYVQAANEIGLTDDIGAIRNYQANCSRGMFAQLIYNAFNLEDKDGNAVNDLAENFGYGSVEEVYVALENDGAVVNLNGNKFTATLINDALKAAGYTESVADLAGLKSKVSMSWFKVDNDTKIASIEVLTTGKVVIYSDEEVKLVNAYKDANGDGKVEIKDEEIDHEYIIINDVKYKVGVEDSVSANEIMGGADVVTVGITVTLNGATVEAGKLAKLPEFFKAFLYDDDGDGDYERCDIIEYAIATVSKAAPEKADEVDQYTVTYQNAASGTVVNKDKKTAAKFSGLEVVADGETPMLIQLGVVADCTVDVIEVAETKSGTVLGLTKSSVKIENAEGEVEIYEFNAKHADFDSKYHLQTANFFTIAGKYVKVTSASTAKLTLMVESVKINEAGNAVVTGYDVDKQFVEKTIEVIGFVNGTGKLNPIGAFRTAEEGKTAKEVYLAAKKDAAVKDIKVTFEDGHYYDFVWASKGYYVVPVTIEDAKAINEIVTDKEYNLYKFSVDGTYVKYATREDGVAVAKSLVKDPAVVVKAVTKLAAGEIYKDIYDKDTYSVMSSVELAQVDTVALQSKDKKVQVVYIEKTAIGGQNIIDNPLSSTNTIVQIIDNAHEFGYSADIYKAVDLFTGAVVDVTGNAKKGSYYVADAEYKLVDDVALDGKWVFDTNMSQIEVNYNGGIIPSYYAYSTRLAKSVVNENAEPTVELLGANNKVVRPEYYVAKKEFSPVIYLVDSAKGVIKTADGKGVTMGATDFAEAYRNKGGFFPVNAAYEYTYTKDVAYGVDTHKVDFVAVDTYVVGDTMIIIAEIKDDVISSKYTKVPAGNIVKVIGEKTEEGYEAFDLFAGEVVTVKSEKKLTKGNFYIAENGVVADAATTKWIDDKTVMAAKDEEDKTYYKASPVIAIKDVIADTDPVFYTAEPAEYTAEQIVIYEVAEDGSFTKISVAEAIETAEYFDTAYVAADQIIIIVEPEVTEAE